ncbi:hypothetical protein HMPREF0322_05280 [Desulfitobacterium hafniense DP7]|uniref:Uncharacterized protein n=1 Tax=Desulfitobacterium hafniense DP7 TaxID=537010 RepID=G9XWB3_DESHA|nr:hypothetical protein HMPREF0322_05280 [Desulfitobacterium hafniense DP7]
MLAPLAEFLSHSMYFQVALFHGKFYRAAIIISRQAVTSCHPCTYIKSRNNKKSPLFLTLMKPLRRGKNSKGDQSLCYSVKETLGFARIMCNCLITVLSYVKMMCNCLITLLSLVKVMCDCVKTVLAFAKVMYHYAKIIRLSWLYSAAFLWGPS